MGQPLHAVFAEIALAVAVPGADKGLRQNHRVFDQVGKFVLVDLPVVLRPQGGEGVQALLLQPFRHLQSFTVVEPEGAPLLEVLRGPVFALGA